MKRSYNKAKRVLAVETVAKQYIEEAKAITFDGHTFPDSGWVVIMGGSGGSGKGFTLRHNTLIHGKVLNVDTLKKLYNKNARRLGDAHTYTDENGDIHYGYDMRDAVQTDILHRKIAQKDWKEMQREYLWKSMKDNARKENLIFDITGKSARDLIDICEPAKECGYKTCFVWTVCSKEKAEERNNKRNRIVPSDVLNDTRNQINGYLPDFLKNYGADVFDAAWIVFSSGIGNTEVPDENDITFQLVKNGRGFDFPQGIEGRLYQVLGINQ